MFNDDIVEKIENGGIGVIPTDTMYGIVGSALNKITVEKIFDLRRRDKNKPLIVLISKIEDVYIFNPDIPENTFNFLRRIWPDKVTVIFSVADEKFNYLSRGTKTIAMRLPQNLELRELISKTGPIVAPSVNTEGNSPSQNLDEAKKYFPNLDFYVDGGELDNVPSTVIKFENGKVEVLRQGAWQVPDFFIT
jgi:L-threonylcarbamoyladenylate synthase